MANDATKLFNFYRRYRWRAQDFDLLQTSLDGLRAGHSEGLLGASVLDGFDVDLDTNMDLDVSAGIAVGASGYLNVITEVSNITLTAPSANLEKCLIVVRPLLEDADDITSPTNPFNTVPLTKILGSEVVAVRGTPSATPTYPSVQDNDVILCGVRLKTGQTAIADEDLDFEVRDLPGKNSNFHQNAGKYDDRLRPFLYTYKVVGIKPSQLFAPQARALSYVRNRPSIFPQDISNHYSHGDTYVDMQSGAITGADAISADFTPTIPTSNNAIVACLAIRYDDTVVCSYGTIGTRAQCKDGIKNQLASGAGCISIPSNSKPICFVVVASSNGTTVSDIEIIDARGDFYVNIGSNYDAIVGGGGTDQTHANLAAAVADSGLGTNLKVLVKGSETINTKITLNKAGWQVEFAPGVVFTKGSATTGIELAADGIVLRWGKMAGFTTSGDKAIALTSAGVYCQITGMRFVVSTDTEVDDSAVPAGKKPRLQNITEV